MWRGDHAYGSTLPLVPVGRYRPYLSGRHSASRDTRLTNAEADEGFIDL
jgi:hypothetical protein